jgi:hypothetical protein
MIGEFAGASEDDFVAVEEEGAGFSRGELDGIGSVTGEFQKTTGGSFGWAGDCSGGEDVSGLEIASVACVVSYELGRSPIKIAGAALAQSDRLQIIGPHCCRYQRYFELYIEIAMGLVCRVMKVRKRFRVGVTAGSNGSVEGFERCHGGDPRGDCGGEVFGKEGAERLIFPGLDVARGPVVKKAYAEEVVRGVSDGNGGSEHVGLADVKGYLDLVIEGRGGAEGGVELVARRAGLAVRTLDRDTTGKDGGDSSVVADGDVFVVGKERIVGAEDTTYAGGVVDGGVEVSVIGDVGGLDEGRACDGVEGGFCDLAVRGFGAGVEEGGERFADGSLTDRCDARRQKSGFSTSVEIEEVGSYCDAESRLTVVFECAIGEVG